MLDGARPLRQAAHGLPELEDKPIGCLILLAQTRRAWRVSKTLPVWGPPTGLASTAPAGRFRFRRFSPVVRFNGALRRYAPAARRRTLGRRSEAVDSRSCL